MNVFYIWLDWHGIKHALFMFRATRKDAQKCFDNLAFVPPADMYHLLECPDDPSVKAEHPVTDNLNKLSIKNPSSTVPVLSRIQMKQDDGKYIFLDQLQESFEMAFKLKRPLPDSRDADGNSWRDRPKLF